MNFLNKILLSVFLLLFCFLVVRGGQAYSADGYIIQVEGEQVSSPNYLKIQDMDIQNNIATVCQDDGSLCSDVEVVDLDDLDDDMKDKVAGMIDSNYMIEDDYYFNYTVASAAFMILSFVVSVASLRLFVRFPKYPIFHDIHLVSQYGLTVGGLVLIGGLVLLGY